MDYLRWGAYYVCNGTRGAVLVVAGLLTVVSDLLEDARDRARPD